jgi:hypothetical protein
VSPAPEPRTKRATWTPVRADEVDPRRKKVIDNIRAGSERVRARRNAGKAAIVTDVYDAVERDPSLPAKDVIGMFSTEHDEDVLMDNLFGEMVEDELIDWAASLELLDDEPSLTLKQALSGPEREQWRAALVEEFVGIRKMGVFRLIHRRDVPTGRRLMRGKAVFKRKRNEVGDVIRYKARWVVKGFLQVFGEDYLKTTSPTARLETFRVLCHIAATHDLEIRQFDVKTAFLHGDLPDDKRIYMEQLPGFEDPDRPDHVWEVLKGLYGMKQAGRVWNKRLNTDMTDGFGFHRVSSEHCLYHRKSNTGFTLASIHVDDTFGIRHKEELDRLEADLRTRYDITVSDGSYIHQEKYMLLCSAI